MSDRAIVRILVDGTGIGAGFLAANGVVLTCAHVVNDALGLSRDRKPEPPARVEIDFPLDGGRKAPARLLDWKPGGRDIAVLSIDQSPGHPPPLRLAAAPASPGQPFRAFGFPGGFPGRTEHGRVVGPVADGWLEIRPLQNDTHDYFVEQGFSGTPAIADDGVIGMVVATGPEPKKRLAYLLPVPDLERAWPPLARPYRGLAAFDAESARWFRGRDEFVERILAKVRDQPVVAIVGASGSGKSSVVRAGVIPRLRREDWKIAACRVGDRPVASLTRALTPLLDPQASLNDRVKNAHKLEGEFRTSVAAALDYIDALMEKRPGLLILLDQFEELVTLAPPEEQAVFDTILGALVRRGGPAGLRIAVTLRSDYVDAIEHLPCARSLLNEGCVRLTPMNREELAEAVQGPARDLGVGFAAGIDGDLIGQVTRAPALLPLLQYTLKELWQEQQDRTIPVAALERCGGLEGVLGRKADEVLQGLEPARQADAKSLFLKLVVLAEGGVTHDTKRTATRAELGETLWQVAREFAKEGVWLLVINQTGTAENATVEILHEALIRNWPTLALWLEEVRRLRLWEDRLRRQRAQAIAAPDDVWLPHQVAEAQEMLARAELDPDLRTYAEQVLAATEAADLWARLRDFGRFEETADLLPTLAGPVRAAMIDRLRVKADAAEALLRDPWRIGHGLFGIDPARIRSVADWVAAPPRADAPPSILMARCLLGTILQLPTDFAATLIAIGTTKDRGSCWILGQALVALTTYLPDPERHANALVGAIQSTTDRAQCAALRQGLVALAPRVIDPEHYASVITSSFNLRPVNTHDQMATLGMALFALAPHFADPERGADIVLETFKQLSFMQDYPEYEINIGLTFVDLAPRLLQPERFADTLFEIIWTGRSLWNCTRIK